MLNLLGDIFLRSQNLTDKEFIANLERRGIEYTVKRIGTGTYIEVGRFGYRFNERGKSRGGWIRNWAGALRANISETVLVLLINEQGEKEKGKDERKFSWFCFFWELGCHATERRRAWRAEAGTLNMNDRLRVQVPYRVCWRQL